MTEFTSVRIPYAIDETGELLHIRKARNGLGCDCTCPGCGKRMVAKQGMELAWHFAHESEGICVGALESLAHKLGKQMVLHSQALAVPAYGKERRSHIIRLENCRLEQRLGDLQPDVLVNGAGHEIGVEIFVSHRVDRAKADKYRARGLACLEINISHHVDLVENERLFRAAVLVEAIRSWIFHPLIDYGGLTRASDAS